MTRLPLYQPILFYRYLYSIWQYLNIFNTVSIHFYKSTRRRTRSLFVFQLTVVAKQQISNFHCPTLFIHRNNRHKNSTNSLFASALNLPTIPIIL